MQRYKCPKCQGIFCGWSVIYKLKCKCPVCGGKLKKIDPGNKKQKKYRKAVRDHKRVSAFLAMG